jgi:hypothetical protein
MTRPRSSRRRCARPGSVSGRRSVRPGWRYLTACPCICRGGWCIRIRERGSAKRFRGGPGPSKNWPLDAASGLTFMTSIARLWFWIAFAAWMIVLALMVVALLSYARPGSSAKPAASSAGHKNMRPDDLSASWRVCSPVRPGCRPSRPARLSTVPIGGRTTACSASPPCGGEDQRPADHLNRLARCGHSRPSMGASKGP